jgi:hypothetical protein
MEAVISRSCQMQSLIAGQYWSVIKILYGNFMNCEAAGPPLFRRLSRNRRCGSELCNLKLFFAADSLFNIANVELSDCANRIGSRLERVLFGVREARLKCRNVNTPTKYASDRNLIFA